MATSPSPVPLALGGLIIGLMLGAIAAGGYATWAVGGDPANVGFTTILAFLPPTLDAVARTEPIRTALVLWGGVAVVLAIAVPVIGYRRPLTSHGSAHWATAADLKRERLLFRLDRLGGPIYGKLGSPGSRAPFLSSVHIPHSLIAAPTGSGKGVGIVIPTLLTYPGSIFCLDVKGENFAKTSRNRVTMGDDVYRFAPYDDGARTHRYNPLQDVAEVHPRRRFTEARRLAASLIVAHGNGTGFLDGAREIFAATALLAIERGTPSIGAIFDALSQPGEAFATLRDLGTEAKAAEAKKIFHRMSEMESRILSSYLSVLGDGGLGLWADPAVRAATSGSDFSIQTLRSRPTSIYIVVSPNDLVPLAPLIRLMFQQTISILQRAEPDPTRGEKYPVLFLLDEFVSLGRMDVLASAITTLRSFGGRVMIVVQTIASLRDLYGKDGASVFLANCRMQLFMAPADEETPNYISGAVGDFTRKSRSTSWKGGELATSYQEREDGARLIRPEQVRLIGENTVLALVQNSNPILAGKVVYYEDRALKAIFEAQLGSLPEPPPLPRDDAPATLEPMVPDPGETDAPNPLAEYQHEDAGLTAVDTAGAPVSPEEVEFRTAIGIRDRSRRMISAVLTAESMYGAAIRAPDEAVGDRRAAEETILGEEPASAATVHQTLSNEVAAFAAPGTARPRSHGLRRSSLADAEAKHGQVRVH